MSIAHAAFNEYDDARERPIACTHLHRNALAIRIDHTRFHFARCNGGQPMGEIARVYLLTQDLHHQDVGVQIGQIYLEYRTTHLIDGFRDPSRSGMVILQLGNDLIQRTQPSGSQKSNLAHSTAQSFPQTMMDPTGQASPLLRQKHTESTSRTMRETGKFR
uniref:Uncharacterized protein n=1 Tax=Anopheles melas TaxID=34690 RepID=A0A182U3S1_9DIPT